MTLLLISFSIFTIYVLYVIKRIGVISSISDSYFELPDKEKFLFRVFISGISIPIILFARSESVLLFFAGLLILAVFFAPGAKKDHIQDINHVIGATGGIVLAYASFMVDYVTWNNWSKDCFFWAVICFLVSAIIILPLKGIKKPVKNHTWWIEVVAYAIIILTLIINNL